MFQLILVAILLFVIQGRSEAKSIGTAYVSTSQLETGSTVEPKDESRWYGLYSHGMKLLAERKYQAADTTLLASIHEAKNSHGNSIELARSRCGLGFVACASGNFHEAESLFSNALSVGRKSNDPKLLAEALYGMALVSL